MKPWTLAPQLALLLSAQAEALGADYLKLIYEGGVFSGAKATPPAELRRGEKGYTLLPSAYGGEWSVVLGASGSGELASGVHLSFVGGAQALAQSGPTIGKLMARLTSAAATTCFNVGSGRLPALKSWVESSVKSSAQADLNTERTYGPLRAQLITSRSEARAEVDVLLSRRGQPGQGAWVKTCAAR